MEKREYWVEIFGIMEDAIKICHLIFAYLMLIFTTVKQFTHPTTDYLDNRCYRELRSYIYVTRNDR